MAIVANVYWNITHDDPSLVGKRSVEEIVLKQLNRQLGEKGVSFLHAGHKNKTQMEQVFKYKK